MAPHTIAGSHPRRDVSPRRDRPRPTWRSIRRQLAEREDELDATRATNRELMTRLNRQTRTGATSRATPVADARVPPTTLDLHQRDPLTARTEWTLREPW